MTLTGTCHCGATRFEVDAAPADLTECNCTYCSKVGALWAYYKPEDFRVISEDRPGLYSQTGYNKHHFCANCGCSTYGISPAWSLDGNHDMEKFQIGINARLFDDFEVGALPVNRIDGRNLW